MSLRPRVRQSLTDQADELRAFRQIATLQPTGVERPPDAPTDFAGAARRRATLDEPACGALGRVGERLTGNPWSEPHGRRLPMFGRFRKTNDPAQETDGGAVAVDERERDAPATSVAAPERDRVDEPATSRTRHGRDHAGFRPGRPRAPADRVEETGSGDGDTRVAERDRVADRDRFARDERAPADDPSGCATTSRARSRPSWRGHRRGHARPPARPLRRHPLGQRLLRAAERHRPRRPAARHRGRGRRHPRRLRDQ